MIYDTRKDNCFSTLQVIQANNLLLNKISASYKMLILLDKAKREFASSDFIGAESTLEQLIDLVCK